MRLEALLHFQMANTGHLYVAFSRYHFMVSLSVLSFTGPQFPFLSFPSHPNSVISEKDFRVFSVF